MTITTTLTNQGTLLSCVPAAGSAPRHGSGMPVSAHLIGGLRRVERLWTTTDVDFANAALNGAYPQADVDVPTIKKNHRVPLSIRERSS